MANTEDELLQSLEIFNKTLPGEILASEVHDHTEKIILSMVQLKKHRDALSLQLHNPLRSLSYVRDEVVIFENKLYKAVGDGIEGDFNPVFWEEIQFTGGGDSLLTRTIFDHDFDKGDLAYYDTITNEYKKAFANAEALINDSFALFVVTNVSGDEVTFGGPGTMLTLSLPGLIPSAIYLSNSTAGGLIDFIPTAPFYQQVGFYADGIFHFNPAPVKITNPTPNAVNEGLVLSGTNLQLRDSNSTLSVDLSSLNRGASFKRTILNHMFVVGDLAYYDGTEYKKALAPIGLATLLVLDVMGPDVVFGVAGAILESDSISFQEGAVLYLSDDTSIEGKITDVKPNTLPIQEVGQFVEGTIVFNPKVDLSPSIINQTLTLNGSLLELADDAGTVTADLGALGGTSFTREIVGNTFTKGELAYYNGTEYVKAIADVSAVDNDSFALYVIKDVTGGTSEVVTFGSVGTVLEVDLGFTGSPILYLSHDTDGLVVDAKPDTDVYQQIGHYADGLLFFNPIPVKIEIDSSNFVEKDGDKVLSEESFTTAEKAKLASLESSLFLGQFTSLAALETTHSVANIGNFAYVDEGVGHDVNTYVWDNDDNKWVNQKGITTAETSTSIKTKYESNTDTNVLTDDLLQKLQDAKTGAEVDADVATLNTSITGIETDLNAFIDAQPQLTAKGDLFAHNGTDLVRLPIGLDGYELVADSTAQEGVRWKKKTRTVTLPFQYKGDLNSSNRGLSAHDGGDTRSWANSGVKSPDVIALIAPFEGKIKAIKGFISEIQIVQSVSNASDVKADFQFYGDHYFNGGNILGPEISLPFADGVTANAGGFVDMVGSNTWGREMKVKDLDIDVREGQIIGLAFVPKFSSSNAQAIRDVVLQVIFEENE